MAGTAIATVYAQFFSFFYRVSFLANCFLAVFGIATFILGRKGIHDFGKNVWKRNSASVCVIAGVLFFAWAFFSSRGYMVPDTALYHAQAIRWIEEYGIIPGQGILNSRFSYNSSIFSLTALFSLKFVFGQSLHAMNGWIAFVLSLTLLDVRKGFRKFRLSDFANVTAIYYLTSITDEVIAPSSDYATMCTVFFIVIKWIRQMELPKEEQSTEAYGLLCVLGVYALTLKLTAGLILLFTIKPAVELIRSGKIRQILIFLGMGLVTAIPWLIRGVLISGWLFYPLYQLDLFDLPWKQLKEAVRIDANSIQTWARNVHDGSDGSQPIWEWYGTWLESLSRMEILFVHLALVSFLVVVVAICIPQMRKKWFTPDRLLLLVTLACCYGYWQLSAPMPRYGYAYLLLFPAVVFGGGVLLMKKDLPIRLLFALYGVYKIVMIAMYIKGCWAYPSYILQEDYSSTVEEVTIRTVDGIEFYRSLSEGLGYDYFPGENAGMLFELIGDDLREGLRWCEPSE